MRQCGLLGRKLGHSYSPAIHAQFGPYAVGYDLFEKEPEELHAFLTGDEWHGINVTIPYKKAVVPYCHTLSETAQMLQSVNTIVHRPDGTLYGENTDYYGFQSLIRQSGKGIRGRKALVLGSGGASVTVCAVLRDMNAESVTVISRSGEDNYVNLHRHADAQIIVNATPVGMYPNNSQSPVDLRLFPRCEAVYDLVYNPARTALLLQAEELGIPGFGGLHMLVAQAKRSSEIFTTSCITDVKVRRIEQNLRRQMENIILVGMPGCGKSTVAAALGEALGRQVRDSDALIEELAGKAIPEIFAADGEEAFRALEKEALRELGKQSGIIIATGGGCVKREENYPLLHQNGRIFWLQRNISALPIHGRPLSQSGDLQAMYDARRPLYERFADAVIDNNGPLEDTVNAIKEVLG